MGPRNDAPLKLISNHIFFRRKRKRRDATGKLDYDRPADYNLPLVPHPPGNCAVSNKLLYYMILLMN